MPSAREVAAQRRQRLFSDREFTTPLKGYEDLYSVRYRVLPYEQLRAIGAKIDKIKGINDADREVFSAADTLVQACAGILEITDGEPVPTGHAWTAEAARELFGADLPDGATARQALRAVLPSTELMLHFQEYDRHVASVNADVEETAEGESAATSVASSNSELELPSPALTYAG